MLFGQFQPQRPSADEPAPYTRVTKNIHTFRAPKCSGKDVHLCNCKAGTDCSTSSCINRSSRIECIQCTNDGKCSNRALQKRKYAQVEVFKTPHCGWGLRARESIKAGALVQEYLGEVIDFSEMSHRLEKYRPGQPM
jgi:hypothetical protein